MTRVRSHPYFLAFLLAALPWALSPAGAQEKPAAQAL